MFIEHQVMLCKQPDWRVWHRSNWGYVARSEECRQSQTVSRPILGPQSQVDPNADSNWWNLEWVQGHHSRYS